MYLIDTNVVSETRKRGKANPGVTRFFQQARTNEDRVYVSVITVGEIRRRIELTVTEATHAKRDSWKHGLD